MPKLTKKRMLSVAKAACIKAEEDLVAFGEVEGTCLYLHHAEWPSTNSCWSPIAVRMRDYFQPRSDDVEHAKQERGVMIYAGNWMDEHGNRTGMGLPKYELNHQRLTLLALFYSAVEAGIIKPEDN